jgi:alkyl sulfatase BDS1-like metallo-beta-lactamase superfamily hydrolase
MTAGGGFPTSDSLLRGQRLVSEALAWRLALRVSMSRVQHNAKVLRERHSWPDTGGNAFRVVTGQLG